MKILVLYFSGVGSTRKVAELIGSLVGMSRSAVQRHRKKTLDELRNKLTALMPKGG